MGCLRRSVPDQLAALQRAAAFPAFTADHFAMAATLAAASAAAGGGAGVGGSQHQRGCQEVRLIAEKARLQRLTQAPPPLDYAAVAAVSAWAVGMRIARGRRLVWGGGGQEATGHCLRDCEVLASFEALTRLLLHLLPLTQLSCPPPPSQTDRPTDLP